MNSVIQISDSESDGDSDAQVELKNVANITDLLEPSSSQSPLLKLIANSQPQQADPKDDVSDFSDSIMIIEELSQTPTKRASSSNDCKKAPSAAITAPAPVPAAVTSTPPAVTTGTSTNAVTSSPPLPSMADIVSINDTLEESEFSFAAKTPSPKRRKKAPQLDQRAKAFEASIKAFTSPLKNLSKYTAKEIQEVNKVKRTKEELMAEMIITVPEIVHLKFQKITEPPLYEIQLDNFSRNTIKWKRKVHATYSKARDIFIPCEPTEILESCTVMYYDAETFADKLLGNNLHPPRGVILIVEGYFQYLAKLRNHENKVYREKVLNNNKFKDTDVGTTANDVEAAVDELQYEQMINFLPVKNGADTIEWLGTLTHTIASSLYDKYDRHPDLANLIVGKSGTDTKSTYIESLTKFKMLAPPKCERLFLYYNSLQKIFKKFVVSESLGKDLNDRRLIPESTEKGMKRFFTSDDPSELIYD